MAAQCATDQQGAFLAGMEASEEGVDPNPDRPGLPDATITAGGPDEGESGRLSPLASHIASQRCCVCGGEAYSLVRDTIYENEFTGAVRHSSWRAYCPDHNVNTRTCGS